jgi:alkylhydroperoxidase family enzyme
VSRNDGVTEQQLLDLADYETSAAFSDLERLVLRYATAMSETPVEVPDELFAELRYHFQPKQMVELTSAIAWENYRARFDHAFGVESEDYSEGAACALPVGGHRNAGKQAAFADQS